MSLLSICLSMTPASLAGHNYLVSGSFPATKPIGCDVRRIVMPAECTVTVNSCVSRRPGSSERLTCDFFAVWNGSKWGRGCTARPTLARRRRCWVGLSSSMMRDEEQPSDTLEGIRSAESELKSNRFERPLPVKSSRVCFKGAGLFRPWAVGTKERQGVETNPGRSKATTPRVDRHGLLLSANPKASLLLSAEPPATDKASF